MAVGRGHEPGLRNVEDPRLDAASAELADAGLDVDGKAAGASPLGRFRTLANPRPNHMKTHLHRPLTPAARRS